MPIATCGDRGSRYLEALLIGEFRSLIECCTVVCAALLQSWWVTVAALILLNTIRCGRPIPRNCFCTTPSPEARDEGGCRRRGLFRAGY